MGKDITKKFTINLEIATKDAEKQVAASADNIKKLLNLSKKKTEICQYCGRKCEKGD